MMLQYTLRNLGPTTLAGLRGSSFLSVRYTWLYLTLQLFKIAGECDDTGPASASMVAEGDGLWNKKVPRTGILVVRLDGRLDSFGLGARLDFCSSVRCSLCDQVCPSRYLEWICIECYECYVGPPCTALVSDRASVLALKQPVCLSLPGRAESVTKGQKGPTWDQLQMSSNLCGSGIGI